MPVLVELRNGQTVEFPEEASPDQIEAALRQDFPAEFQSEIQIAPGTGEINPNANRAEDLQATTRGGPPLSLPAGAMRSTLNELAGGAAEVLNVPKNLGGTMGFSGDVVRAGVADIASNVAGTEFAGNIPAVFTGEPLPIDQALDDASEEQARQGGFPWATVLGRTSQGMAKLAPKLVAAGVVGGPTLLGQSVAAGGLFGLDDEGNFHPKEAAFAALFPVVGKAGRMVAAGALSKAALSGSKVAANPTAQKAVELAADNAAQFAYATATQAPELIELSKTDPQAFQQSLGELIAMQLGFSLLGLRHLRGETPSETQRWIEKRGQEMAVKLATDQKYADSVDAAVIEAMNPKNGRSGRAATATAPEGMVTAEQIRAEPSRQADEQSPAATRQGDVARSAEAAAVPGERTENVPGAGAPTAPAQEQSAALMVELTRRSQEVNELTKQYEKLRARPAGKTTETRLKRMEEERLLQQRIDALDAEREQVRGQYARAREREGLNNRPLVDSGEAEVQAEIAKIKSQTGPLSNSERIDLSEYKLKQQQGQKITTLGQAYFENLVERSKAVEAPAAAAAKVQEHVAEVAAKAKPAKPEAALTTTIGPRAAKEIKSELVERLEAAIEKAPATADFKYPPRQGGNVVHWPAGAKVTIEIPGDGSFTIANHKDAIRQVLKDAKMLSTSAGTEPRDIRVSELTTHRARMERIEKDAVATYGDPRRAISKMREQAENPDLEIEPRQRDELKTVADALEAKLPENVLRETIQQTTDSLTDLRDVLETQQAKLPQLKEAATAAKAELYRRLDEKKPSKKAGDLRAKADNEVSETERDIKQKIERIKQLTQRLAESQAELAKLETTTTPSASQYKTGDTVIYQGKEVKITKAVPRSEFVGIGQRAVNIKEIQPVPAKAESPARAAGTGGIGFPMSAPVPAIPPPAPAPGTTMIQHGRLPVTLDRTAPGSVSVPQIMDSMTKVLRVAGSDAGNIRTGRFLQKALGIWKPHEEIIRLESADSIPTATHEIGHGLQQKIYGTALASGLKFFGPAIRRELIGMGKALYGNRKPVAGYTGEGFAEFTRYWLTTDDAAKVAPNLTRFFEQQFLPAHPEVAKALTDARDLVSIWRAQGSVERANRQLVREPGALKRMAEALGKLVSYQAQFESGAPIEAISKAAARKLGRQLNPSEDPFKLFSWKRGSAGATVERMATEHMLELWGNPTGPSLAEALAPIKGKRNEFLLYIFAQAAEMRWRQEKNPGISLADAQHIKALYDSPEFRLAADKYRKWNDGLLDYVVQADPAMADAVKAMRGANDYYAPLARMIDPAKAKSAAANAQGNALQRMYGSGLPVKDIFDQTFINAARLVNRANRALVARSIVKLAEVPGLGHIVEEVPRDRVREQFSVEQIRKQLDDMGVDTTMIPQDEILQYYSLADTPKGSDPIVTVKDASGKQRWYQVDPRLYDQLEGLQKFNLRSIPHVGVLADIFIGMPTRAFKLGTTGLRPSFSLVTNPTRDLATLLAQSSQNPAKMAAMYPAALKEAITGGPYKDAFFDLGAHLGQPLGQDIGHTKRVSKELFHGRFMKVVTNPVDHFRELLGITESAPRIAELRAVAEDIGWTPGTRMTPDQSVTLALAAKRITTDFSASGDFSRIMNETVPFYNPALQGARAFARTFKNNPAKATLVGLSLFTVPALVNWWRNKDKEWYTALPWREKYLYTNVDDGKNVWQIPRPFEWGNAFQVIPEALFDSWHRQEPEAAKQALSHIFESSNPVDLPVLAKIAKEQWSNRVAFWDRPIVPRGEIDLPPSEQVGPYTSRLAVGINKAFPELSPRRVDAAIRGYFGGAGTDVMQLLGVGANKTDREWEASDFPVFGSIFRRGGEFNAQNQHINDFWETYLPSRARVDGFNFAKSQAEQGLRKPETVKPPGTGDVVTAQIGEDAGKAIRLLTMLAARTKDTKARSELYRQAGQVAEQATTAMKNAANMNKR